MNFVVFLLSTAVFHLSLVSALGGCLSYSVGCLLTAGLLNSGSDAASARGGGRQFKRHNYFRGGRPHILNPGNNLYEIDDDDSFEFYTNQNGNGPSDQVRTTL